MFSDTDNTAFNNTLIFYNMNKSTGAWDFEYCNLVDIGNSTFTAMVLKANTFKGIAYMTSENTLFRLYKQLICLILSRVYSASKHPQMLCMQFS